jgi:sugar phosphate isomerase/epimerase
MNPLEVGVTSWSLKMPSLDAVFDKLEQMDLRVVQIGPVQTDPDGIDAYVRALRACRQAHPDVAVSALMVGWAGEDYSSIDAIHRTGGYGDPATAEDRVGRTLRALQVAADLQVPVLTTHIGFVPADTVGEPFARMVEHVRRIGDAAAASGVQFAMETGQETAEELLAFLGAVDRAAVKVNFDPANMILYGRGEPLAALRLLGPQVVHVHCKDALWSDRPGQTWGREVPLGKGSVDIPAYVAELKSLGYKGPLVIEREGGESRFEDIAAGKRLLESLV